MSRSLPRWAAALAAIPLLAAAAVASPFDDLLKRVPDTANAIMFANVHALQRSPLGQKSKWGEQSAQKFQAGISHLPPTAERLLVALHIDPHSLHYDWRIELVQMPGAVDCEGVCRREGGTREKIAGLNAVLSPRGSYFVQLQPSVFAEVHPADRQRVGRWVRFCQTNNAPVVSPYLRDAAEATGFSSSAVLAVDLRDLFNEEGLRARLKDSKLLSGARADLEQIVQTLASIQGLQIRIRVDSEIQGSIRLDFAQSADALSPFMKPLILNAMGAMGASVDEVESWKPRLENKAIVLEGTLSERAARLLLSPADSRSTRTAYAELQRDPKSPPDPKATASYQYFRSLNTLLDDLTDNKKDTKTVSKRAYWYQLYAQKLDGLPLLNVDPELLDFGAKVSQTLRLMANVGKLAQSQNALIKANQVDNLPIIVPTTYGWGGGGGYGYGNGGYYGGGWGWTNTVYQSADFSNYRQIGNLCAQNANTEKAFREQTWKNINDGLFTLRRKMVDKYQMEF
jgi:hypothetical protein